MSTSRLGIGVWLGGFAICVYIRSLGGILPVADADVGKASRTTFTVFGISSFVKGLALLSLVRRVSLTELARFPFPLKLIISVTGWLMACSHFPSCSTAHALLQIVPPLVPRDPVLCS